MQTLPRALYLSKTRLCCIRGCHATATMPYQLCPKHHAMRHRRSCEKALQLKAARDAYALRPGGQPTNVYAVRGGGLVKLGNTIDVETRLLTLQIGSPVPLVLAGFVACSEQVERDLHEYLAEHRSHGEWFRPAPQVEALVMLIAARDLRGMLEFMSIEPALLPVKAPRPRLR